MIYKIKKFWIIITYEIYKILKVSMTNKLLVALKNFYELIRENT